MVQYYWKELCLCCYYNSTFNFWENTIQSVDKENQYNQIDQIKDHQDIIVKKIDTRNEVSLIEVED